MTIKFHSNIRNLMIGRGILGAGLTSATGITIYSGAQPSAANIVANWSSYNSSNASFLAHYSGAIWTHPLSGAATFCNITTLPDPVYPTNNGTGAWAIIWTTNPSAPQLADVVIPTNDFLVGPISTLALGTGIVKFDVDLVFSTIVLKPLADGSISASST